MLEQKSVFDFVDDYINETSENTANLSRDRLITHAADFISELQRSSLPQLKHRIALLEVDNYIAVLPKSFHQIQEIAYKTNEVQVRSRWEVTQLIYNNITANCDLEINIKCPECDKNMQLPDGCDSCEASYVEVNLDSIWNSAHPEYAYFWNKFQRGTGSLLNNPSQFHQGFQLLRPNTSPYSNTRYHIPTCRNLGIQESAATYQLDIPKVIVNFKHGLILLSYLGTNVDEDGMPLILGHPRVYEAVNFYLDEKLMWNSWRKTKSEADYKSFMLVRQLREKSQALAKDALNPWDMKSFWADMKKYYQTRVGRPYDRTLLK